MDLIPENRKQEVFEKRCKEIAERVNKFEFRCFATCIWETSLYRAWTYIVSSLIMDMDKLKVGLKNFALACNAEEVILFEKSTFLLTCHYSSSNKIDEHL